MDLIVWLVIGGLIGWLASILMKTGAQMGLIANVIVGIVGAALGGWIAGVLGIGGGRVFSYIIAVLGAAILIVWHPLTEAGRQMLTFNPTRFDSPFNWLARDHRKSIVVDGRIAYVTGLCISGAWLDHPQKNQEPWRDTGIQGPRCRAVAMSACLRQRGQVGKLLGGNPLREPLRGGTPFPPLATIFPKLRRTPEDSRRLNRATTYGSTRRPVSTSSRKSDVAAVFRKGRHRVRFP